MNNSESMNNSVRLFFKKYFGDSGDIIKPGREPLYRLFSKEWSDKEESDLTAMFNNCNREESEFILFLRNQRKEMQEIFGVSYSAIINKCQYMGLIPVNRTGLTHETHTDAVYAFPNIHTDEFPSEIRGFDNYSLLLASNIVPEITPAFSFQSAAHEQFTHVTLPIVYRGVDIERYNESERVVISSAWHYISDNANTKKFHREGGDIIVNPIQDYNDEPKILEIQRSRNNLIQLEFRNSLEPLNTVETIAIRMDKLVPHSREIYFFKHKENPTYENTRA